MASTTTTTSTTAPPATKGAVHATPAAASPSIPRFHFTKYTLPPFTDDEGAGDSTDTHVDQTNATGLSSSNGHESRNENGISNTSTLPGADLLHQLTTEECVCILYQTVNRLLQASAESDPTGSPDSNTDATTSEDKTTALIAQHFNSSARAPPPIHPWDYLLRLHHYCPMSQSVYLSASLYLTRLCAPPQLVGSSHDKGTVSPGPPVTLTPLNVPSAPAGGATDRVQSDWGYQFQAAALRLDCGRLDPWPVPLGDCVAVSAWFWCFHWHGRPLRAPAWPAAVKRLPTSSRRQTVPSQNTSKQTRGAIATTWWF